MRTLYGLTVALEDTEPRTSLSFCGCLGGTGPNGSVELTRQFFRGESMLSAAAV